MKIYLSSIRGESTITVSKQADALTINGIAYDFTNIPEGATLPASAVDCEFIIDNIERTNGELHITLMMPHGPDASEAVRFPAPLINPPDGVLELQK
jgi:hypothetical protein